jgi:succinyl-diaminopimelate desuccinylase
MEETSDRAALTELTRQLIDIPSVSRNEAEVSAFVRASLPAWLPIVYDDDSVIFAMAPRRTGVPLVTIAGHTDTVPIESNVPSSIDGDIIYGRGASDMKGALAVMLHLVAHMDEPPPHVDVALLFFGREELPTADNALLPAFDECAAMRATDFAILMEPTSNAIEAGCQGNLNLHLTYEGVSAHSARPWTGRNAVHEAVQALQALASAEPNDVDIDGLVFREVANVTSINGGTARNVLPNEATVDINVRYAPNRSAADAEAHWRQKFEGEHVRVEVIGNASPAPVVRTHPFVDALLAAGASAPVAKQAWTNAADFAHHNIPAVNFGPGDANLAHTRNEHVSVDALVASCKTLRAFLREVGSS